MKTKTTKTLISVKNESVEFPWTREKPVFEQPVLQLPLPSPFEMEYKEIPTKEKEEKESGVWTIDI